LLGVGVGGFVAFALEGVLGAVDREALLLEQTPDLVVAVMNAGDLSQVLGQACGRPGGKAVAQLQGTGQDGLTQLVQEGRRRLRGPTRTGPGLEGIEPPLAIEPPDPRDGVRAAAQEGSNLCHRTTGMGAQNDQAVAKHVGRGRGKAQLIEGVPLGVGKVERWPHEDLLTVSDDSCQGRKTGGSWLDDSFCVPT
jgi:hypothetical protein